MQDKKKVSCPCCRNGRLFDVALNDQIGYGEIDIKRPRCGNVISRINKFALIKAMHERL